MTPEATENFQTNLASASPVLHYNPAHQEARQLPSSRSPGAYLRRTVIPNSVFFQNTQKRFEESEEGCQRRPLPAGRANKLPRGGGARSQPSGRSNKTLQAPGPSPRGEAHPPFPWPHLVPGEPRRCTGPHVWHGEGSGGLALRLPLSLLVSRTPEQQSPPSLGPPSLCRDAFRPRPLTPDPPSPKRLPRLVLQAPRASLHQGSGPSNAPAGPGHAFATQRTSTWGRHARFRLACVAVPWGAQKPQLLGAGRALERGVKVNAHVGAPRPLCPAVASWVSSAQVHMVRDSRKTRSKSRDISTPRHWRIQDWLEPLRRRRGSKRI